MFWSGFFLVLSLYPRLTGRNPGHVHQLWQKRQKWRTPIHCSGAICWAIYYNINMYISGDGISFIHNINITPQHDRDQLTTRGPHYSLYTSLPAFYIHYLRINHTNSGILGLVWQYLHVYLHYFMKFFFFLNPMFYNWDIRCHGNMKTLRIFAFHTLLIHLTCACIVPSHHGAMRTQFNIIKPAILVQKRAIRVINNAPYKSHRPQILKNLAF